MIQFRKNGGNIIIATPGRLVDFLEKMKIVDLTSFEVLVLDEADRLLEMGFEHDINTIFRKLPKQRRTGLFSATQTKVLKELIRAGLRNPVQINVQVENKDTNKAQMIPEKLTNYFVVVEVEEKLSTLFHFLAKHKNKKTIVFFLTCDCVNFFWKAFSIFLAGERESYFHHSLHGKVPQNKRTLIYNKFVEAKEGVLFTTDLAARGLDFPDIDWIVQYDAPQNPNAFVHRIGRTARMDRSGDSLLFLSPNETSYVEFLGSRKVPIKEMKIGKEEKLQIRDVLPMLKQEQTQDRDFMERGRAALVSYIRGYKEHQCNFIFNLDTLDLGKLAKGFAMLKFPKMKDLKRKNIQFEAMDIKLSSIPFKDPKKEKERLEKLQKMQAEKIASKEKQLGEKKMDKMKKEKSKEKSKRKRRAKVRGGHEFTMDEIEDINDEFRMLKKLRKGKLSQKEFDKKMGVNQEFGNRIFNDNVGRAMDHALQGTSNLKPKKSKNTAKPKKKRKGTKKVGADGLTLTEY